MAYWSVKPTVATSRTPATMIPKPRELTKVVIDRRHLVDVRVVGGLGAGRGSLLVYRADREEVVDLSLGDQAEDRLRAIGGELRDVVRRLPVMVRREEDGPARSDVADLLPLVDELFAVGEVVDHDGTGHAVGDTQYVVIDHARLDALRLERRKADDVHAVVV